MNAMSALPWSAAVASALLIFALRIVDVSAATLRLLFVIRGQKALAWVLGFFQALVFVLAISKVLTDLDNVLNMVGYAAGFATGTVVGMWLEERLAVGYAHVRVISPRQGAALAQGCASGLPSPKWPPGRDGTVTVLNLSVTRRQVPEIRDLVTRLDPNAFITVEEIRPLRRGYFRA
jgi:Uncharacterized protein conserved in bacteria